MKISDKDFYEKHLKIIKHEYSRSKYFSYLFSRLEDLKTNIKKTENLSEINIFLIKKICDILDIKLSFQKSSDFSLKEKRTKKLISICKQLNQKKLLSNEGMKKYLLDDAVVLKESQVDIQMYKYNIKEYSQPSKKFLSNLSILDLIFNLGPDCKKFIKSGAEKIKFL